MAEDERIYMHQVNVNVVIVLWNFRSCLTQTVKLKSAFHTKIQVLNSILWNLWERLKKSMLETQHFAYRSKTFSITYRFWSLGGFFLLLDTLKFCFWCLSKHLMKSFLNSKLKISMFLFRRGNANHVSYFICNKRKLSEQKCILFNIIDFFIADLGRPYERKTQKCTNRRWYCDYRNVKSCLMILMMSNNFFFNNRDYNKTSQ